RPVRPPARIGRPAIDRTMTVTTASVPLRAPRIAPASMTPIDCKVIGTPEDPTVIWPGRPSATISAANTAICARSRADSLLAEEVKADTAVRLLSWLLVRGTRVGRLQHIARLGGRVGSGWGKSPI